MNADIYMMKRRLFPIYRINEQGFAVLADDPSPEDAAYLAMLAQTNTMRDYPNRESRFKNVKD